MRLFMRGDFSQSRRILSTIVHSHCRWIGTCSNLFLLGNDSDIFRNRFYHLILMFSLSLVGAGCNNSEIKRSIEISFSNSAVNFPIWASVVVRDGVGVIHFLDLSDGTRRVLARPGVSFTSVQAIPDEYGNFVISAKESGRFVLLRYDFFDKTSSENLSSNERLIQPFVLSGKYCGLRPTVVTDKGLYEFYIVCDGVPINISERIKTFDYAYSSPEESVFKDNSENVYYVVRLIDDELKLDRVNFDAAVHQFSFYHNKVLYSVSRADPKKSYILINQSFLPYSDVLTATMGRAKVPTNEEVFYFGDDEFVTAHPDVSKGEIRVKVWTISGDILKTYGVEVVVD
ncbi:MAG: hypothetical protein EOS21_29695 [Mesorhizobium sp.]|nr:MAG: hypothetical protein EOS21_29695 [Mesorhizobium sp.]